nr:uncharacterized protein LOC113830340 [Penaeus vannamei]
MGKDGQDEQLVADDAEGGHLQRWAVRVSAGVIGLLLMAAAGMLLRAVDHRYPASRLWAASSGAKLSIGVLLTDTPLDKDLLRAALRAAREQHSASARLSDIHVKQAQTHGTALGAIDAFKKLWNEGVKIFLIGGENSDILRALCKHIESSGHAGLLVSPEAMVSRDVCPCLVSLSPAQEAVVVVEAGRFLEAKVSHVVPVVTTSEAGQLTHLVEAAEARNLSVTPAVLLDPQHISLAQLKERLAEYPNAGVWISLGSDLPHLFAEMSYLVCGRLVMIHAHAAQRARLLRHPLAREAAEKCGVCSAAWAGSTRVDTSARRRLLDDLQPEDPLFASLAYDITGLALAALTVGRDASLPELRAQLLNHDSLNGVTGSMKDGRRSGWVARLRLVAQRLVGWAVLQDTPWLLEGSTQVASEDEGPWATVQETHAPTHMVTQEEILDIINRGRCNRSARVEVTAHDPLTHRAVTTSWSPAEAPYLLLIPNGSPNGFTIKAWCHERDGIPSIEVGCHGASKHSEALVCAFATMDRGRRVVRSILTKHVFPFRRQQYHRQKAYQEQINRRQDYYQLQGQQHYEQHGQQQGYHEQQQQGYHEQQQPATTATQQQGYHEQQQQGYHEQQQQGYHEQQQQGYHEQQRQSYEHQYYQDQQYQHQDYQQPQYQQQDHQEDQAEQYQQEEEEPQEQKEQDPPKMQANRPFRGGPFSKAFKKLKAYLTHEDFKSMIPQIGGCVGATGGCTFCFMYLLYNDVGVSPGVCYGACSVAVGGSCTTLLAKGLQYHLDHTVICSELFSQGHLSLTSYLADATFGSRLAASNPRGLKGYQILATPIVAAMQVSPGVTAVVEAVSQPWIRHMEYEEGLRAADDVVGSLMTSLGLPVCSLVAMAIDHVDAIVLVTMTAALWRRARS